MRARARPVLMLMGGLLFAVAMFAPLPTMAQTQPQTQTQPQAQTPPQAPDAELDQRLVKYDPAAVKAARHYAEVFNMKAVLSQSMPAVRDAIVGMIKQKNPQLDDASVK